jgi:hypothetical protein
MMIGGLIISPCLTNDINQVVNYEVSTIRKFIIVLNSASLKAVFFASGIVIHGVK